jgi:hypothetical protein
MISVSNGLHPIVHESEETIQLQRPFKGVFRRMFFFFDNVLAKAEKSPFTPIKLKAN